MPSYDKNDDFTVNYQLYLLDKQFKEKTNLIATVTETRNFYNGKQYDDDGNEFNEIRVSLNFCSFAAQLKAAKIVGTERYVTFTADSVEYDCSKLQRFDEYNIAKLNEKVKDNQSCIDGFVDGTAIAYYRWDEDDTTYKGIYKGGLVLENVDILKFAVANKYLNDIQNQKWVMFWHEEEVNAVRDIVERKNKKDLEEVKKLIVPDNYNREDDFDQSDIDFGICTLYTRFFRIDGEVCFMCSTDKVDIFEYPHFMNPNVNVRIKKKLIDIVDEYKDRAQNKLTKEIEDDDTNRVVDYKIDYQNLIEQLDEHNVFSEKEYENLKEKFYLYPFARFVPYEIKNSFYGRSDVTDMIRVQKGFNFAISMVLKCVENNAYNKIIAKEDALEGQEITNEPGQIIIDHSRMSNSFGIKFAETQPVPNGVIDFAERILSMTRLLYGFNDVMDGSVSNQDISGYAIQQMIKQANSSIEQQQQIFWHFCEEKAEIRLLFYKFYVDKAKYTFERPDYDIEKNEQSRKALKRRQEQLNLQGKSLEVGDVNLDIATSKNKVENFDGKDLWGINFDISVDVLQGLADSKLAESQMWETLIMNGNLQNMDSEQLEMYLEANPIVSQRSKATLKGILERQKRSENHMLKQYLSQANTYMQQMMAYIKELERQSNMKTQYSDNLTKEFMEKISAANKIIGAQNKYINNMNSRSNKNGLTTQQVSEGEAKSNNARGLGGSDIFGQ